MPHIDNSTDTENRRTTRSHRGRKSILAVSAGLCVAISLAYWWQPDWLAPVTLVPAWCWLAPGLALTAWGMSRKHKLWSLAVMVLWVAYTIVLVEEVRSLARIRSRPTANWVAARARGRGIRVVSLNCYVANWRAAAEVASWEPDIVLLQESPSREHLARLTEDLFGADGTHLWGGDTSILARGTIRPRHVDGTSHFVQATVELPSGLKTEVVSLRLHPPVFRLDFLRPGFWVAHRDNRVRHRRQILDVRQRIRSIRTPLIAGGDFNAVPRDAALDPLRDRLSDTFLEAGHGWGNTGTSRYPLFRVDQIWASPHFLAESVTAQKTIHSDHRMGVCELILASADELETSTSLTEPQYAYGAASDDGTEEEGK
jgi:endonuclease/exonuclease/phosphatase (EEP) superfamily protein YafD